MLKLIVFFVIILLFVQGLRVYWQLFRFFKTKPRSNVPTSIDVTYVPPKQVKRNREGEYIDYEEMP